MSDEPKMRETWGGPTVSEPVIDADPFPVSEDISQLNVSGPEVSVGPTDTEVSVSETDTEPELTRDECLELLTAWDNKRVEAIVARDKAKHALLLARARTADAIQRWQNDGAKVTQEMNTRAWIETQHAERRARVEAMKAAGFNPADGRQLDRWLRGQGMPGSGRPGRVQPVGNARRDGFTVTQAAHENARRIRAKLKPPSVR